MFDAFQKIPKGVNVIVFIWALIGIFLLLRNPKMRKNGTLYLSLGVIGFMVFWRIGVRIISSRYSSGLIIPFVTLASCFLLDSARRRRPLVRLVLYVFIAITGFIVLKMNFDGLSRNQYCDVVAEVFADLEHSNRNCIFATPRNNYIRICTIGGLPIDRMEAMDDEKTFNDYIANYTRVYPDTVVNTSSKMIKGELEKSGNLQKTVSLVENKKGTKHQLIYFITSDNRCAPLSENRIAPYRKNLLENGDFEVLDTPEDSLSKVKSYLADVSGPASSADENVRTPKNVSFVASSESSFFLRPRERKKKTAFAAEFNALNDFSIDGDNSVRIRTAGSAARLMFDKHFTNGKYEYSLLVRGGKRTEIIVFYEVCQGGKRQTVPVATAELTDKRLYQISTDFSVDDLNGEDYFRVGAEVRSGEAFFDDFSLNRLDD